MENKHDKQTHEAAAYAAMVASVERNVEERSTASKGAEAVGRNATDRDAIVHAEALSGRTG